MQVKVAPTTPTVDHAGKRYYFCCPGCATKFGQEPGRYLDSAQAG
jgi:YHS domain-containing protein